MKYPEKIASLPRLRGVMSPHKITYEDLKTLHEWNVNLVRAQMSRNWGAVGTELDLEEWDGWLAGKLDNLEQAMDWGREFGIRFVIDLHCPPGGRNTPDNMRMFNEKKYGDHFIEVWKRISTRFKGHSQLYAYNLINEPVQSLPALPDYDYWNLQRRAAEAIREIDPDTPIMVESNRSDRPETFAYLSPLRMHNIIYKVHMYMPLSYTHQRLSGSGTAAAYPGIIEDAQWNRARIRRELEPVIDFQKRHDCKIYVGEFSAIAWAGLGLDLPLLSRIPGLECRNGGRPDRQYETGKNDSTAESIAQILQAEHHRKIISCPARNSPGAEPPGEPRHAATGRLRHFRQRLSACAPSPQAGCFSRISAIFFNASTACSRWPGDWNNSPIRSGLSASKNSACRTIASMPLRIMP